MGCGHIEFRKMREATAGIPWTPSAIVDNTHGGECAACRDGETEFLARVPTPEPPKTPARPTLYVGGKGTFIHENIRERDRKIRGRLIPGEARMGHHVAVTPGRSIQLYGMRDAFTSESRAGAPHGTKVPYAVTFKIGDTCESDSYNLVYFGKIEAIGRKSVSIRCEVSGLIRLDLATFSRRNYDFNQAKAEARNATELQCI